MFIFCVYMYGYICYCVHVALSTSELPLHAETVAFLTPIIKNKNINSWIKVYSDLISFILGF